MNPNSEASGLPEPLGYVREWEGDDSDLGCYVFVGNADERTGGNWVACYTADQMHEFAEQRAIAAHEAKRPPSTSAQATDDEKIRTLTEAWIARTGKPMPWRVAVEITATIKRLPDEERDRLLALDDPAPSTTATAIADRAFYQRAAVLAGLWPESNIDSVPASFVGAAQKWHHAFEMMASAPSTTVAAGEATYSSTQATDCASCGKHKHTPLRIDAMGGYVCLTCIDQKLGSLLGEFGYPEPPTDPKAVFRVLHDTREAAVNEAERLTAKSIEETGTEPFCFYVVEIIGRVGLINGKLVSEGGAA